MTFKKTKIIATIGPKSDSKEVIKELIASGVDVFRLNFSHGNHKKHKQTIDYILQANEELGSFAGILADLQGPKIRIGDITGDTVNINDGDKLTISIGDFEGTKERVSISYLDFPKDVNVGDLILLDDGILELKVVENNKKDTVVTEVIHGGVLSSRKGVNLPNAYVSIPSLTQKDKEDLEFILTQPVNWLGLSFVRKAQDLEELRSIVKKSGSNIKLISKIEKPQAVADIDNIIKASDAVMIARGDLGVEIPMEELPLLQEKIINKCIDQAKPVIIATQVMQNMIHHSRPTRAEVTDAANGVLEGADALMLSGETAVGKFPVKTVETLRKILDYIETEGDIYWKKLTPNPDSDTFLSDAICFNACKIANEVKAKVVIGMTVSGYTGFMISSYRPKADIVIFTPNRELPCTLSLCWGVRVMFYDKYVSTDETIKDVKQILKEKGIVDQDDIIVNVASMPLKSRGRANMLKVSRIE